MFVFVLEIDWVGERVWEGVWEDDIDEDKESVPVWVSVFDDDIELLIELLSDRVDESEIVRVGVNDGEREEESLGL